MYQKSAQQKRGDLIRIGRGLIRQGFWLTDWPVNLVVAPIIERCPHLRHNFLQRLMQQLAKEKQGTKIIVVGWV
jgi:hypothetical protein